MFRSSVWGMAFATILAMGAGPVGTSPASAQPQSAVAQPLPVPPPEVAALGEAREIYQQIRKKAERNLDLAIDAAASAAAGAGDHPATRHFRELQDALKKQHQIPSDPFLEVPVERYQATMRVADKFLDSYYSEAMGVLSRAERFDEASRLAAERNSWRGGTPQRPAAHPPTSVMKSPTRGPQVPVPPANPPTVPPVGSSQKPTTKPVGPIIPMGPRETIRLQAPPIEGTNPAPDLQVVRATWGVDSPAGAKPPGEPIDVTEQVRKQLQGDHVVAITSSLGELPGAQPKCLTLVLEEAGVQFAFRLYEGSEVVARELPAPLAMANAHPIRGTKLELMLASWGLQASDKGELVTKDYAALFDKQKTVAASTGNLGEPAIKTPKTLRTMWRVGRTLLYVNQSENSRLSVPGAGTPDDLEPLQPPARAKPPVSPPGK